VTVPILRVRHSPGMTRREAARDASNARCESKSSVRGVSCLYPLRRELHAVCQCGAFEGSIHFVGSCSGSSRERIRASLRPAAGCCYAITWDQEAKEDRR